MKIKLGRWYKVTDNLGVPSDHMLLLVEKKAKLGYLKIPIKNYELNRIPTISHVPHSKAATAGYEDSDWRFDWLSDSKVMPANFRPTGIIGEAAMRKAIRILWS